VFRALPPRPEGRGFTRKLMKYLFPLVFCSMLSACGGGTENNSAGSSAISPGNVWIGSGAISPGSDSSGSSAISPGSNSTGSSANDIGTYSGSGIGVWRYDNTSGAAATVNINIGGVSAGKVATLVFSNGSNAPASLPVTGALASPVSASAVLADTASVATAAPVHQDDDGHGHMLERNRAVAAGLIHQRVAAPPLKDLASKPAAEALGAPFIPSLGTSSEWKENYSGTPVRYTATVQAVCSLPSGRSVVWWGDPDIVSSGLFSAAGWSAALASLQASYCGSNGGLARINNLLGDVWGSAASAHADSIKDSPALQNVNVVLLNVPDSSQWAGYFYGEDTKRQASSPDSNEALVFFINASQVKDDLKFAASTLLHESTHMVNFYQRSLARNVVHDTWLEETAAMMTEDIVAPAVLGGYNKALTDRLPAYLASGGNVSYVRWAGELGSSTSHYAMGAGFGAFLNRRYGLSIYQQLVTGCGSSSYACLNGLIQTNGGDSFSDEFARFGASIFGRLPATGLPSGYGYPAKTAGAYSLQAKDLSLLTLASPAKLASGYKETSHTFARDIIPAGKTSYVRSGVVVPANTSLVVTIQ
jgi:hypothetical protein